MRIHIVEGLPIVYMYYTPRVCIIEGDHGLVLINYPSTTVIGIDSVWIQAK